MTDQTQLTPKLPSLIVGVLVSVIGVLSILYGKSKSAFIAGLVLLAAGFGFLIYSHSIKQWCVPKVASYSAFSSQFSPTLNGCLRLKGLLEL